MSLDDSDTRAVLAAVTQLSADPLPSFESVLDLMRGLIGCTSASFNDMTLATGDFRHVIVPGDKVELAERLKPAYDRFAHQHPLIVHSLRSGEAGRGLRYCDVPDGDLFTGSDLYRHFYEPFDIRYQLVVQLPSPPDVVVGYALNRPAAQGEFSDRDVALLEALVAPLALHHRVALSIEQSEAVAVEADHEGWSVVTVRSDGVVAASSSTRLGSAFAAGGRVPDAVAAVLPGGGAADPGHSRHEILLGQERWRCVVRAVPVGPTVLLLRRLAGEPGQVTSLVDAGLTPRQSEVASALATTGGTNTQLARALGMSEGTVKKHLEAVYRVLGVDSRAGAVLAVQTLTGG